MNTRRIASAAAAGAFKKALLRQCVLGTGSH
jgi:hypothetical protein